MSNFVKTNNNQSRGKGFTEGGGHGHLWPPQAALPTWYAGHHFRSRREARWAVFFNTLNISWEYEPQGFDLDGIRYLPDFLLSPRKVQYFDPDVPYDSTPYWFEVKGQRPTAEEQHKAAQLATITNMPCFIYYEQPQLTQDSTAIHFLPEVDQGFEAPWLWNECICRPQAQMDLHGEHWCVMMNKPNAGINATQIQLAFQAARSARFGT